VLAVDRESMQAADSFSVLRAGAEFIDRLPATDWISVVPLGGGAGTGFTADHARARQVLLSLVGQGDPIGTRRRVALTEALAFANGDPSALSDAINRECGPETRRDLLCVKDIEIEANLIAKDAERRGQSSVVGVRRVLTALRRIDAPKTLVLLTGGLGTADAARITDLGGLAVQARVAVYALHADRPYNSPFERGMAPGDQEDRVLASRSLEMLAWYTRGTMLPASAASFGRIEREGAGFYVIGVEARPDDSDGKRHAVHVEVARKGATVRASRHFARAAEVRSSPQERLAEAMASPVLTPGVRLRVASFTFPGRDGGGRVRVMVHAEIGRQHEGPAEIPLAWVLTDTAGKVVRRGSTRAKLAPAGPGPSPLVFREAVELESGAYSLKLAALDGDELGSVEHPVRATLSAVGPVRSSDLLVGRAESGADPASVIREVRPGASVVPYVEVAGEAPASVTFEVAKDPKGPAVVRGDGVAKALGGKATAFAVAFRGDLLPPGAYVVRATVASGDAVVTLVRAVTLLGEAGRGDAAASPSGAGSTPVATEATSSSVAASLIREAMARPFALSDVLEDPLRGALLDRLWPEGASPGPLAPAANAARQGRFAEITVDEQAAAQTAPAAVLLGLRQLQDGALEPAAGSFRQALRLDVSSYPAMAWLAACYAAGGRHREAASAWQTSLIGLEDVSGVYGLLSDALVRSEDMAGSLDVVREARERWPDDPDLLRRAAYLTAETGDLVEGLDLLDRYLKVRQDDTEALFSGTLWIYRLRQAGTTVPAGAERAKEYADRYARLGGAQTALVQEWVAALARER
jgi:tetratricopeptide (TPR) repeat protein